MTILLELYEQLIVETIELLSIEMLEKKLKYFKIVENKSNRFKVHFTCENRNYIIVVIPSTPPEIFFWRHR